MTRLHLVYRAPGEREKDIIKRWVAQGQIGKRNLGSIQIAHNRGEEPGSIGNRNSEVTAFAIEQNLP